MSKLPRYQPQPVRPAALDTYDAASYIGMSSSWLRLVRREGARPAGAEGPPFVRIGNAIRYRIADLDDWLEQHACQSPGKTAR